MMSKTRIICAVGLLIAVFGSCRHSREPEVRVKVVDNPWFKVASPPRLIAGHLSNPMSPRMRGSDLVVAESGSGTVSLIENGKATPLIKGFAQEKFENYKISVEGITIDPKSGWWIIASAEGPGRIQLFDPSTFPTDAQSGRDIMMEGAVDDNPYSTVLADGGRILVVSGGTNKAYQGKFDQVRNPNPVKPVAEVETGLIGLAIEPKSGDVFAAVFGRGPGTGEVVRWDATAQPVVLRKVASGFTNPVDVAFTPDGVLLALEFGEFGSKEAGRVFIVAIDGSGSITPFITGLNNPTGLFFNNNIVYITEFGETANSSEGTLISLGVARGASRGEPGK